MKLQPFIIFLFSTISLHAQTTIEKSFPVQGAGELLIEIDYPNVNIQTWDKNEVLVKGTVSINNGEHNANFELLNSNAAGVLKINSFIKDKDNIPRHVVIKKGEEEFVFKAKDFNDPEVQKFLEEHGREYSYMSNSLLIDVDLQVFVPKNMKTTIDSKYGVVEFKQFDAPLKIVAKYGKVDATISSTVGGITARSRYGEILSNLDIKFDEAPYQYGKRGKNNSWTEITAHPGKGQAYFIEAKYGTVYLRKP